MSVMSSWVMAGVRQTGGVRGQQDGEGKHSCYACLPAGGGNLRDHGPRNQALHLAGKRNLGFNKILGASDLHQA